MHASIRRICLCALFAALITVGAFIRMPVSPVSTITLQLFFVLLAAVVLGPRLSVPAVLAYIILGLTGVPVFASGGGLSYLTQPTFGFVYGFIPAALVAGHVSRRLASSAAPSPKRAVLAAVAGCAAALPPLYICGVAHGALVLSLVMHQDIDLWNIIWGWCLVYLPFDLAKAAAAGYVGSLMARRLPLSLRED